MFPDDSGFATHDFEFNSTPVIELSDAKTTREIFDLRIKYGQDRSEYYRHLEARNDTELQKSRDSVRNTHLESMRWYSQSAFRFGDYIMKYSVVPTTETQRKLYEETVKSDDTEDVLSRWLQNFHQDHDAEFAMQVQLCENLNEQSVENAGEEWDAEKYPWQNVARLVAPRQDSFDYQRKAFWEDHIRMNPWLGLVKLQPLGGLNRLRRVGELPHFKELMQC
jgi:hypothetical protein